MSFIFRSTALAFLLAQCSTALRKGVRTDDMVDTEEKKEQQVLAPNASVNDMGLMQDLEPSISCVQHTGGSCAIMNCDEWRGPTTCSVARCFCEEGYCSTIEGKCLKKQNKEVGNNFTLRNARYPDHFMYFSEYSSGVYVSTDLDHKSYFDLYRIADNSTDNDEFFLGSHYWNMWVATVDKHEECERTTNNEGHSTCRTVTEVAAVPIKRYASTDIASLAVRLVAAPPYEGQPAGVQSVMIESYAYPRRFFSLSSMSWTLSASYGDDGTNSYWLPDKPLPIQLKAYHGRRCSFDCGAYGSGTSKTAMMFISGGIGAFILALIGAAIFGMCNRR